MGKTDLINGNEWVYEQEWMSLWTGKNEFINGNKWAYEWE